MANISTAQLAAMRAAIYNLLPDLCDIYTATHSQDAMGAPTVTWSVAYASVACRVDIKSGQEMLEGGAIQAYTQVVITLPYDTVITDADRVVHAGITYNVKPGNPDQSWLTSKRYILEQVS